MTVSSDQVSEDLDHAPVQYLINDKVCGKLSAMTAASSKDTNSYPSLIKTTCRPLTAS